MAERLVNDPTRPGLNSQDRDVNTVSEFIKVAGTDDTEQDAQLKQLKLIKTHMEVLTGEDLELSQTDDDDAGAH